MSKPTLAIYGIQDRGEFEFPAYVHDHNICLMADGKVEKYLHLERLTRRKNDNRLPLFIEDIIEEYLPELFQEDFDLVSVNSFVGNAFLSKKGKLRIEPTQSAQSMTASLLSCQGYWQYQQWQGKPIEAYMISHELAHVATCLPFFGHFRENSLLVHFDGGASLGNFSTFLYRNGQLKPLECHWQMANYSKFFNDNGLVFGILGARGGMHCSVPGKLMGLAALGTYDEDLADWLRENDYFSNCWTNQRPAFFKKAKAEMRWQGEGFDTRDPFFQNLAAVFEHDFQEAILEKLTQLQSQYKVDYLYYSGGCSLNITTNSKIIESGLFKDVFIPPANNDAGLSIGAAAFREYQKGNNIQLHSPYLNNIGLDKEEMDNITIAEVANLINEGNVVGICNGKGEAGPRALGNRSIVARADSKAISQRISQKCKKREWYRPVAPVMLAHNAEYFVGKPLHPLSRYMLLEFPIPTKHKQELEGVVHNNCTSRIQIINKESFNYYLYKLLIFLEKNYKIKSIINTSLNTQGEPIVHTQEDGLKSATDMGLDAIVLNGKLKFV